MKSDVFLGDCVDFMRTLPDECIDLTVTSPPYDNQRAYDGFSFDYKQTLEQLFRVTKDGGVVVWIVADQTVNGSETGTSFREALCAMECGFRLHDTMIWEKDTFSFPCKSRYHNAFEYMFVFSKGSPKTYNLIADKPNKWRGRCIHGTWRQPDGSTKKRRANVMCCTETGRRYNVWHINTEHNNTSGHPAVFPLPLVRDHIISWSNEGETVFDPFLGSGTTRIAAEQLRRNFIGCEISEKYYAIQEKRYNDFFSQMSIFEGGQKNV